MGADVRASVTKVLPCRRAPITRPAQSQGDRGVPLCRRQPARRRTDGGHRARGRRLAVRGGARPVGPQGRRREPPARGGPGVPRRPRGRPGPAGPPPRRRLGARCPRLRRPPRLDRAPASGRRPWTTSAGSSTSTSPRCAPDGPTSRRTTRPLWLVCTNGRRDRCCAEAGRPIAAALSARWPEETWETTHLGGHRFAGTLLALPSGLALGRLDAGSAVAACKELEAGRLPLGHARGRAGRPPAVQVAELHLRAELDLDDAAPADALSVDGDTVVLGIGGADYAVEVGRIRTDPRRQSCADLKTKPGWEYRVRSWRRLTA